MITAKYQNYSHYIKEGWLKHPKEFFKKIFKFIQEEKISKQSRLLDIGCATGELIHFLSTNFPDFEYTGVDVFEELIEKAKQLQPKHTFVNESILSLPTYMAEQYDVVTATGVMSIFNELELHIFWENIFKAIKKGGWVYVLSPLNEFGVDMQIQHRKRVEDQRTHWETGWNIYCFETIEEILRNYQCKYCFDRFQINQDLQPRKDPVRTWTISTEKNPKQLTNGLKLLVDHYFIKVQKI